MVAIKETFDNGFYFQQSAMMSTEILEELNSEQPVKPSSIMKKRKSQILSSLEAEGILKMLVSDIPYRPTKI